MSIKNQENQVAASHQISGPLGPSARLSVVPMHEPRPEPVAHAEKFFAYNLTRERFIATGVEATEGSASDVEALLRDIGRGGEKALWIVPFRAISPASVRLPVDLVILDNKCLVLETAESFPMTEPGTASELAASLLVLPEGCLREAESRAGDRLFIAQRREMKEVLQRLQRAHEPKTGVGPVLQQKARTALESPTGKTGSVRSTGESEPKGKSVEANEFAQSASSDKIPEFTGTAEPKALPNERVRPWEKKEPKNWFVRLLVGETPDPRSSTRRELPGLIAFFFTGGAPEEHPVRDISRSGLYVVTSERWYQGTVVRMTLTDRHKPTVERSITVNAKVVRLGSDGVGLEFILAGDGRRHGKAFELTDQSNGVDVSQIDSFICALHAN